jgi:4-hydroxybenzoate polyprenyltransferase
MIRTILFRLGHLGILISLCGASLVYSFDVLSGHAGDFAGPLFALLTVFVVYNFDHLRDSQRTDKESTPERARYMHRYAGLFRILIGSCAIGFVAAAWFHRPAFLGIGAFYVLSGLFYVLPLLPGKRVKRLKDIPLFKNFYVPACWLILPLYSQVDFRRLDADLALTLALGYFFLRLFISCTTGDIRDLKADAAANVKTVATLTSRANTFRLLLGLNLASIGLIGAACLRQVWPVESLIMIFPVAYIMALLRIMELHPGQGEFISEIFDFELMAYGPVLLALSLIR